jgi:hypothetical protein
MGDFACFFCRRNGFCTNYVRYLQRLPGKLWFSSARVRLAGRQPIFAKGRIDRKAAGRPGGEVTMQLPVTGYRQSDILGFKPHMAMRK